MPAYLLHIDTATTMCSVAVSSNEELIFCKELNEGFTHAENLHLFIDEALKSSNINVKELSAIVVSKGPGSYTGLRIGASTAKGLAYALNIPIISLNTLQIMAAFAIAEKKEKANYCAMIDARRMEVYTACYSDILKEIQTTEALVVDEISIQKFIGPEKFFFFGDGMPKCKSILEKNNNAFFIENILPSARYMPILGFKKFIDKDFEDVAYFEPYYLKDFLVGKKKKAV